ncbi:MAG: radical SAM-associated putative lipoprotein [Spirochaetales bacterium]|nr:radical SAM-associated putative lipoprotein [Spirochaetales bacterium]
MKKLLTYLFAGSTTLILAGCYGVPYDIRPDGEKIDLKVTNGNGDPIPGLQLESRNSSYSISYYHNLIKTNEEGNATIQFYDGDDLNSCSVVIYDIDGEANLGEFKEKTVEINSTDKSYDVEMELK